VDRGREGGGKGKRGEGNRLLNRETRREKEEGRTKASNDMCCERMWDPFDRCSSCICCVSCIF
jgi:hypothetical protein